MTDGLSAHDAWALDRLRGLSALSGGWVPRPSFMAGDGAWDRLVALGLAEERPGRRRSSPNEYRPVEKPSLLG